MGSSAGVAGRGSGEEKGSGALLGTGSSPVSIGTVTTLGLAGISGCESVAMTSIGGLGVVGLKGGAEHAVKKVKRTEARRRMGVGIGPVTFKS